MKYKTGFMFLTVFLLMLASTVSITSSQPFNGKGEDQQGPPWSNGNFSDAIDHINKVVNKTQKKQGFNETEMQNKIEQWEEKFNKTTEEVKEKWQKGKQMMQQMKNKHGFFGNWSYQHGYGAGDLLKFMFDGQNGSILGYTLIREEGNITVFDSIDIESSVLKEDSVSYHGAVWRCEGENVQVEIHDNPTSLLKIKAAEQVNVSLELGEGFTAKGTMVDNIIAIQGEVDSKIIVSKENLSNNVSVSIENNNTVNISLEKDSSMLFMTSPMQGVGVGVSNELENITQQAIAQNRIGARIAIQKREQIHTHAIQYNNVSTSVAEVSKNRIRINVTSALKQGKTIIADIDTQTINVSKAKNIQVVFDGENISMADDYKDVTNASDDNGTAEYITVMGSNGVQVLVSIPSFSTHTIEIIGTTEQAGWNIPGFGLVLAISVLAMFAVVSRMLKKRR